MFYGWNKEWGVSRRTLELGSKKFIQLSSNENKKI